MESKKDPTEKDGSKTAKDQKKGKRSKQIEKKNKKGQKTFIIYYSIVYFC